MVDGQKLMSAHIRDIATVASSNQILSFTSLSIDTDDRSGAQ